MKNPTTKSAQRKARSAPPHGSAIPRDEYARDRKSEVLHYLRAALESAERGYWTQCKERTAEALKSAKQWEHAADVWREWPNAESSHTAGRKE